MSDLIAKAMGAAYGPKAELNYVLGPGFDPNNPQPFRQGDPEPRPIFLGKAYRDRPFQTQTEEGYARVPDVIRQLAMREGFQIRGAENIGELTPRDPDVLANTEFDKHRINLSSQTPERNRSDIAHELGHIFDRYGGWFGLSTNDPYYQNYIAESKNPATQGTYGGQGGYDEGYAELFATALLKGLPVEDVYRLYPKIYPKSMAAVKADIDEYLKSAKELPR